MARRARSLRDLRAEHEAAVARGLIPEEPEKRTRDSYARAAAPRPRAVTPPKLKVVWAVCDLANKPVATFAYNEKERAEAFAAELKSRGKGNHFVRAEKVPLD